MTTTADSLPTPEEAAQIELTKAAELTLLGRMLGVRSLRRNLDHEDKAAAKHIESQESLWFERPMPSAKDRDEPMDIMATGNVYVNDKPPSQKNPRLPRWAAATLAALAGGGLGLAAASLIPDREPAPVVAPSDSPPGYTLEIE